MPCTGRPRVRASAVLRVDSLSALMLAFVTFVGSLIHLYSVGYMGHEEGYPRYFSYLNLFMFAMLTLVLGANLAVLFIGFGVFRFLTGAGFGGLWTAFIGWFLLDAANSSGGPSM